ncbi:hypothetical protein ES832_22125, partial [Salmonella enterica]|nr:hypothetical protein [Salmonella enterica]
HTWGNLARRWISIPTIIVLLFKIFISFFTRLQKTQRYNRPFFGLRLCNRYITPYTVKLVF